jgi:hypothetical protein
MKNNQALLALLLLPMLAISSCSVVTGIFKAGMGFGIFLVIAVVGLIIYLISRGTRK